MTKIYEIIITPSAKQRLKEISNYIATAYGTPHTAETIILELFKTINSLNTFPNRFKIVNENFGSKLNIRKTRCKNYFIYYLVNENQSIVHILDVIYVKADQNRALHIIVQKM